MKKKDGKAERKGYFCVRFTEKEREYLDEKAAEAGLTAGEYLRRSMRGKQFDYVIHKQVNDLIYEVHRIGNNINQIAHNANCGYYNESESRRLLANMKILTDLVGKAAAKIGDM